MKLTQLRKKTANEHGDIEIYIEDDWHAWKVTGIDFRNGALVIKSKSLEKYIDNYSME